MSRRKKVDWNINVRLPEKQKTKRNGELLPESIRCLIVGPSNCGKSTLMIDNFILSPGWLDWKGKHLYIFSTSLNQPKYSQLQDYYNSIEKDIGHPIATFSREDMPLDDCKSNSVVVFDDYMLVNQNNVRDFFTRGRHKNIDCFYLAQTYTKVPKQCVRDNVNFLCLFRQDNTNLKHIYDDFVCGDVTFDELRTMCSECWDEDYGFMTIDMTRKLKDGKYRNKIKDFLFT